MQIAIAANLLTNSLPLLHKLDKLETGRESMLKIELKVILATLCGELDASDVPHELQAWFADGAQVMKVFNIWDVAGRSRRRAAFALNGPWAKIFTPVDIDRATLIVESESDRYPSAMAAVLSRVLSLRFGWVYIPITDVDGRVCCINLVCVM